MAEQQDFDYAKWEAEYEAREQAAIANLDRAWTVRGFRGHQTHDGYAYVCKLVYSGKVVATVEDEGRGGGPMLWWTDGWHGKAAQAFMAEAERLGYTGVLAEESLVGTIITVAGH